MRAANLASGTPFAKSDAFLEELSYSISVRSARLEKFNFRTRSRRLVNLFKLVTLDSARGNERRVYQSSSIDEKLFYYNKYKISRVRHISLSQRNARGWALRAAHDVAGSEFHALFFIRDAISFSNERTCRCATPTDSKRTQVFVVVRPHLDYKSRDNPI